ncbi:hydroxypyruvate isomerase family protein [Denitrobaculum tricleocarpae]|uniref:TIM barrel protein n=1 Tax=Denitrobaculum tricleocarpae TaxID=2591009 RepID=A0A545TWN2_9PROT|nr:TIM barrel protein [Denitrobaculum tricleocarpae]TQV81628.1 TIM barrel protein [Denitrobaculum tricleocarpae]
MSGFSANLGFLWTELSLPEAIRAAARAGFDAVECHCPYDTPVEEVKAALEETGLLMLGINTERGNLAAGDNGVAAIPGREEEARALIDQAIAYAQAIGARNIHVMAGFAQGNAARESFVENLHYACDRAAEHGITIVIEPLNHYDAPGYFLNNADQAAEIIEAVGAANLKLMFDCYHIQIMQGDITRRLEQFMPIIGHIQIAAVPTRAEPDNGELDYRHVMRSIRALGFTAPVGAEYRPATTTEAGLGWMTKIA